MSNVVEPETFVRRFRDPVSTGTNEDGALKLLSRFPDPEKVREIRDQWVEDLNEDRDFSLLHYASRNGWCDVSRKLVEQYHSDVHLKSLWSFTPLHCACQGKGNIDIVRFLIVEQHCDPTCCGRMGRTPLHWACESGKLDMVRFLMEECHCDPRVEDNYGDTPLHCAYGGNGNIDIVKFLIVDQHCDPACCVSWGRTPLHWVCESGKVDIVKFLLLRSATVILECKIWMETLHYTGLVKRMEMQTLSGFSLLTSIVIQHVVGDGIELHCTGLVSVGN